MENPFKNQQPKVAVDPVTGAVIGSAESPEEQLQKVRENFEDWKEAA